MVLRTSQFRKLLIVCYGNIHRSPYAAELLRKRLAGLCHVRSAGWHQVAGRETPPHFAAMSSILGVNLADHRSTVIAPADVAWADVIVLMDRHNWQALHRFVVDPGKIIWLGALDGGGEILDPYGMTEEQANHVMRRVHRCAEALAAEILARHNSSAAQPLR